MFFSIGFWFSTVVFTKIVRNKINKFIINNYKNLSKRLKMQVDELLDLNFFTKAGIIDYIPILNVLNVSIKLGNLCEEYEMVKKDIYRDFPVLEFQEKVDKNNIGRTYDEEKMYFIGYFWNSRPMNIFFKFNGEELIILDKSASIFSTLSDEEKEDYLLYLLYSWYNGGYCYLNGSNNLNEVFSENLVNVLYQKYDGVQILCQEEAMILSRKRK